MAGGRIKVEWLNLPNSEPAWFDTEEELQSHLELIRGCPVDDGPIRLRITRFATASIERVEIP
jgi:hypothetical protein